MGNPKKKKPSKKAIKAVAKTAVRGSVGGSYPSLGDMSHNKGSRAQTVTKAKKIVAMAKKKSKKKKKPTYRNTF
jgi:hypothetical protein